MDLSSKFASKKGKKKIMEMSKTAFFFFSFVQDKNASKTFIFKFPPFSF